MSAENMIIYAGWYTPQAWNRLKELSIDSDKMAKTYEEFQANFKEQKRAWEAAGETITVIMIDPEHMAAWCKKQGLPLDGVGRATYGSMLGAVDGDKAKMDETPIGDPHGLLRRATDAS